MAPHSHYTGRGFVLARSVPLAGLWAWLLVPPFVFEAEPSQPSLKPSNQPQGNFITPSNFITSRPIYTPKGKPRRKAVVLEDGKHTALQQESSRGSGREEEEAAGKQGLPADGRAVMAQALQGQ